MGVMVLIKSLGVKVIKVVVIVLVEVVKKCMLFIITIIFHFLRQSIKTFQKY